MEFRETVGTLAAICTTGAFIPQIVKIRKQGGKDLSYAMLAVYFVGVSLWLIYGLMLHAPSVIWANAASVLLVAIAIVLKATFPGRSAATSSGQAQDAPAESEAAGD
jgi:MtN3 and saliva related transmembrane protein